MLLLDETASIKCWLPGPPLARRRSYVNRLFIMCSFCNNRGYDYVAHDITKVIHLIAVITDTAGTQTSAPINGVSIVSWLI